jgi:limonene-1,2-epoxide hydrolase
MDIESIVKDGNIVFMQWKMTMIFKKYPSTPMYGCTKLTLGEDGRIIHQRDYFDMWGDIFNNIPYFKKPYRKFLRNKFG